MSPHREDKGESLQEGRKGKVCLVETQRDRETGGDVRTVGARLPRGTVSRV